VNLLIYNEYISYNIFHNICDLRPTKKSLSTKKNNYNFLLKKNDA